MEENKLYKFHVYTSILSQFEIHHSKSDGFTEFSEYDKKTHFNFDFR